MNQSPPTGSQTVAEAFAAAKWPVLFPRLVRRARYLLRRCGWAESAKTRPAAMQAEELVGTMVLALLAGARTWVPECDATEDGLVAFIVMSMWSLLTDCYTLATHARTERWDAALDEIADEGPSALRVIEAKRKLDRIHQALQGDAPALAFLEALHEGAAASAQLARERGWSNDQMIGERWRITRRLASQGITGNDNDGEAEPPSSGPPWRDHEDAQSPDERPRANREHARGARRAGRRR